MFLRILQIVAVFFVSSANFVFGLFPLLAPFYLVSYFAFPREQFISFASYSGLVLCASALVVLFFYLTLDFIFGLTVSRSVKGAKKAHKVEGIGTLIQDIANYCKEPFKLKNFDVYYHAGKEVQAFAVGSLRRKAILISKGLCDKIEANSVDKKDFVKSLSGVIAHEVSHLKNMDFLPGLIYRASLKSSDLISSIVTLLFRIILLPLYFSPFGRHRLRAIIFRSVSFLDFICAIFDRLIISKIYIFLSLVFSRQVEYRCDRQAAIVFGKESISTALGKISKNQSSFSTIFSTHPSLQNRVKSINKIQDKDSKSMQKALLLNYLSNVTAMIGILGISFWVIYSAKFHILPEQFFVFKQYFLNNFYYKTPLKDIMPTIKMLIREGKAILGIYSNRGI